MVAVDTIERMNEEIELKDNKINVLEKELKYVNLWSRKNSDCLTSRWGV